MWPEGLWFLREVPKLGTCDELWGGQALLGLDINLATEPSPAAKKTEAGGWLEIINFIPVLPLKFSRKI